MAVSREEFLAAIYDEAGGGTTLSVDFLKLAQRLDLSEVERSAHVSFLDQRGDLADVDIANSAGRLTVQGVERVERQR